MPQGQRQQLPRREFEGQEGGRWINRPPTSEELSAWFQANVRLHDGMEHDHYISGIVMVSAKEQVDGAAEREGRTYIQRYEQTVYVPYPRVDTRIAYFWDLMERNAERWVGVIEPVDVPRSESAKAHLPAGMAYQQVQTERGITTFIVATARAAIYERDSYAQVLAGRPARPVRQGVGTKAVPVLQYPDKADPNAVMKAETGAVGRALGMAGILVVGSGIATAEDMGEANADTPAVQEREQAPAPPQPPVDADPEAARRQAEEAEEAIREQAASNIAALRQHFPEAWADVKAWADERHFTRLADLNGPALKGFARKVEMTLVRAREAAQEPAQAAEGAEDA